MRTKDCVSNRRRMPEKYALRCVTNFQPTGPDASNEEDLHQDWPRYSASWMKWLDCGLPIMHFSASNSTLVLYSITRDGGCPIEELGFAPERDYLSPSLALALFLK